MRNFDEMFILLEFHCFVTDSSIDLFLLLRRFATARTSNSHGNTQGSSESSNGGEKAEKTAPGRVAEWIDRYRGDCTQNSQEEPNPYEHVLLGES